MTLPNRRPEWWDSSSCAGKLHVFYPIEGESRREAHVRRNVAIAICETCPVLEQCRQYASETRFFFRSGAVVGGLFWPDGGRGGPLRVEKRACRDCGERTIVAPPQGRPALMCDRCRTKRRLQEQMDARLRKRRAKNERGVA